jgi:hypothetical protein
LHRTFTDSLGAPSGPGTEGISFRYRWIKPGEDASNNQRLRVLDAVPFEEEEESPFVGLLQVQAA